MAKLTWDESYSVGIKIIDSQHKKWFNIIGKLEDGMQNASGNQDSLFLEDVIFELKSYVAFHFGEEEKYFKRFNYEDSEMHLKLHRAYTDKVNELHAALLRGEAGMAERLLEFVQTWAANHIKVSDKKYSAALKELDEK